MAGPSLTLIGRKNTVARQKLENEYDVDKVWTSSQDQHGHSVQNRVNYPKSWAGQVAELVHSREWPEYRSPQDFVRDAIYHRLHWAHNSQRTTDPELAAVLAESAIESMLDPFLSASDQYSRVEKRIEEAGGLAISHGDQVAFQKVLNNIEDYIREHIRPPYLDRLLDRVGQWRKRTDPFI